MRSFFKWTSGRHTAFAIYFALVGTAFQWFHRLDTTFIMFIGAVQALVLGHSIQENFFANQNGPAPTAPSLTTPPNEGLNPPGPKNF